MDILTQEERETRIAELEVEMANVDGHTPCEVYTRIVGYFRSVKNWNPGKKSEYGIRVLFNPDYQNLPDAKPVVETVKRQSFIPEKAKLSDIVAGFGQIK